MVDPACVRPAAAAAAAAAPRHRSSPGRCAGVLEDVAFIKSSSTGFGRFQFPWQLSRA